MKKLLGLLPLALVLACSHTVTEDDADMGDDAITSNDAQIVDFNFDGQVKTAKTEDTKKAIVGQLFYTVGQLTSNFDANGQVGRADLTSITETTSGDTKTIKYHARMPVAWPKGREVPRTYNVVLPNDSRSDKLAAFNAKYDGRCGKNEYGQDVFWHDFNPTAQGCTVDAADVVKSSARVTKNKDVTQNKYPEYNKVWEDGHLDVVAIFGYSDGGAQGDAGAAEYDDFVQRTTDLLAGATKKDGAVSPSIPRSITLSTNQVTVTVLQVDTLYQAGPDWATRYDPLSEKADLVIYNGHSELSKNTNALAAMGKVVAKKYQVFFFDSCDTYAYLDTNLTQRRIDTNGAADDPKGTKYLDVATNVLPSYFNNYASSSLSLFKALMQRQTPKSYNEILSELPSDQVVVITGEEDNSFTP